MDVRRLGWADGYGEQDIESLETLVKLEQLWLGKNKITELKV